ncbi:MAG: cyclic pyranopterin monophosphate synthase MoaC [Myxococcota bacterium]
MPKHPSGLSHIDESGAAHMVHVGKKPSTDRVARAEAVVRMGPAAMKFLTAADSPKGDVLAAARIAGIQGAKRTSELIPLCHNIPLDGVEIQFELGETLRIEASARALARTGVEMEAMTAASVAALTVYDMLKAVDRWMTIERVQLLEKRGGKSGELIRPAP